MKTKIVDLMKEKGAMARELVYYCLRRLTIFATWAMVLKTVALILDRQIDLTDVLVFIGGCFGGELLFLLVKRLLAKPTDKTDPEEEEEINGV